MRVDDCGSLNAEWTNELPIPTRSVVTVEPSTLAARGESLAAFDRRCIPVGCVAPLSNTPGILGRRALPPGRLAGLGATPDFHHGLLGPNLVGLGEGNVDRGGRPTIGRVDQRRTVGLSYSTEAVRTRTSDRAAAPASAFSWC